MVSKRGNGPSGRRVCTKVASVVVSCFLRFRLVSSAVCFAKYTNRAPPLGLRHGFSFAEESSPPALILCAVELAQRLKVITPTFEVIKQLNPAPQ